MHYRKKMFSTITSVKDQIMASAKQIEQILNLEVLGDNDGSAQWSVPMHDDGKTVGAIMFDNNRIQKVLEHFGIFNDASMSDEASWNKYCDFIPKYCDAMQIVQQKDKFSNED
jgi:hypothetical protein